MRQVVVNAFGVQKDGMSTNRLNNRYTPVGQQLAQITHLSHPGPDVVVLHCLGNADSQGFHIATGHTTVGVESLINDHQVAGLVKNLRIINRRC